MPVDEQQSGFTINFDGKTDVGRRRSVNQDRFIAGRVYLPQGEATLLAVADGMGGAAGGEIASQHAVDELRRMLESAPPDRTEAELLADAVTAANRAIFSHATADSSLHGMGTTVVSVLVRGHRAVVAHVGDSRAALVRDGTLYPLTADHSWVAEQVRRGELTEEQAAVSNFRNVLTRSVGVAADVQAEVSDPFSVLSGDIFVLCSDGLHGVVDNATIAALVRDYDPDDATRMLVDLANDRGGPDNITVVVGRVDGPPASEIADTLPLSSPPAARVTPEDVFPAVTNGVGMTPAPAIPSLYAGPTASAGAPARSPTVEMPLFRPTRESVEPAGEPRAGDAAIGHTPIAAPQAPTSHTAAGAPGHSFPASVKRPRSGLMLGSMAAVLLLAAVGGFSLFTRGSNSPADNASTARPTEPAAAQPTALATPPQVPAAQTTPGPEPTSTGAIPVPRLLPLSQMPACLNAPLTPENISATPPRAVSPCRLVMPSGGEGAEWVLSTYDVSAPCLVAINPGNDPEQPEPLTRRPGGGPNDLNLIGGNHYRLMSEPECRPFVLGLELSPRAPTRPALPVAVSGVATAVSGALPRPPSVTATPPR